MVPEGDGGGGGGDDLVLGFGEDPFAAGEPGAFLPPECHRIDGQPLDEPHAVCRDRVAMYLFCKVFLGRGQGATTGGEEKEEENNGTHGPTLAKGFCRDEGQNAMSAARRYCDGKATVRIFHRPSAAQG